MTTKSVKRRPDQFKAFVQTAKDLGCNESEAAFDKTLKALGTAEPSGKPKPKNKARSK